MLKHHTEQASHVFVPVTDELIFDHPEKIEGPLIPYASGMECHGWLSIEINPDESRPVQTRTAVERPIPELRLAFSR